MGFISLGKINKSLLFILLMSVFMVLYQYIYGFEYIECFYPMNIYRILYNAIIDNTKTDFYHHRIFDPLFCYIGVIILSFLIPKEVEKKEREGSEIRERIRTKQVSQLTLDLIHHEIYEYLLEKNIFWVLLKIILLWIMEENLLLIFVDIFQDLDFSFFELIFVSYIFSKNFFFKIYSHQKLGMAISIGVGSSLKFYNIIISIVPNQNEEDKKFYQKYPFLCFFTLFYLLLILTRSYVNTQLKVLMDLKFISLRSLLLMYGIIGFVMCLLFGIIFSFVPCFAFINNYVCKIKYEDKMYFDHFLNYYESGLNLLVRLIIIVLGAITFFLNKYFFICIIKFYTPIHVIFSFPIQFFIEKTFLLIFTGLFFREDLFSREILLEKFLLDISGDIASIIGFLIFLEMIELNFCGFNYNLMKNIINRGEKDYKVLKDFNTKLREGTVSMDSDDSLFE